MKKIMKLAVITTLMAIGIATANAQVTNTNTTTISTNVTLSLNISLTGFRQTDESNAAPVRITNRDIFNNLNSSSNGFAFGRTAKLMVMSSTDGSSGPSFFVRERTTGTNVTDTPLTGIITVSQTDEIVARGGKRYTILTLTFDNGAGTDFIVIGFATLREGRASGGRGVGSVQNVTTIVTATVSGPGHIDGAAAIFKGSVNASGPKAETVEITTSNE